MEGFFTYWTGCPNGSFIVYKRTWASTVRSLEFVVSPIVDGASLLACILTIVIIVRIKDEFVKARGLLGIMTMSDLLFLGLRLIRWYSTIAPRIETVNATFVFATSTARKVCMGMSRAMLVLVTVQRVLYIKRPHTVDRICTTPRYVSTIVISFIIVLIVSSAYLIGLLDPTTRAQPLSEASSTDTNDAMVILSEIQQVIFFIIPLIVLVVGNTIIIQELVQIFQRQKQLRVVHNKRERQYISAIFIVVLLFVAFCVTVIPYLVFYFYIKHRSTAMESLPCSQSEEYAKALYGILYEGSLHQIILSVTPFLNFLMYILSSTRYRKSIKYFVSCLSCCKPTTQKQDKSKTSTGTSGTDKTAVSTSVSHTSRR